MLHVTIKHCSKPSDNGLAEDINESAIYCCDEKENGIQVFSDSENATGLKFCFIVNICIY